MSKKSSWSSLVLALVILSSPSEDVEAGQFYILDIGSAVTSEQLPDSPLVGARATAQYIGKVEPSDRSWSIGAQLRPAGSSTWSIGNPNSGYEASGIPSGMIVHCNYDGCGASENIDRCTSSNSDNAYNYRGVVAISHTDTGNNEVDDQVGIGLLECDCQGCGCGESAYSARVVPHFGNYQGEDVEGSMTVTLIEKPEDPNPLTQSVTIEAPGGPRTFPMEVQACSDFHASVASSTGLRCSVVPNAGQVDGPVDLDAYCIQMPGDICEIASFFCEEQPPDGTGTGHCTFIMRTITGTIWTHTDTPTSTGGILRLITINVAVALCPGGQLTDDDAERSQIVEPEPAVLYLRNGDGTTYEVGSTIVVEGVARDQGQGIEPSIYLDGTPITLANLQIALQDDDTCDEVPTSPCTPFSKFQGDLDLSGLSEGTHRLSLSAESTMGGGAFYEIEFNIGEPDGGAEVLSHTLPTNKSCGEAWTSTVTMKNTGPETWTSSGCYKLAPVGDSDPFAGNLRIPLPGGISVPPNGEVTFSIPMTAPAASGAFTTDWRMISELFCGGDGWFGETAESTVTLDCVKDARVVSHTLPSSMTCGENRNATITLENTGTAVWREGQLYYLGARGGTDPFSPQLTYGLSDPEVLPGETASVDVQLNAGSTMSGTFTTDWGLYQNGSGFGHTASSQVDVSCIIDDAAVVSHTIPPVMTCGETVYANLTLRNTGTTTWSYASGSGYVLAAPTTDPLRPGPPYWFVVPAGVTVAPQQSHTWTVPLTAPDVPDPLGSVTSWRLLKTGMGNFGETLFGNVDIECPGVLEVSGPTGGLIQDGGTLFVGNADADVTLPFAVQLCNQGTSHIVITPKGAPRFIYGTGFFGTVDPDRDLPPGACTSIGGYFQAGATGSYSGHLQFDTTTQEDPYEITLLAEVNAPPPPEIRIRALGSSIPHGGSFTFPQIEVPPGGNHEVDFEVCNDGQGPLEVEPPVVTGDTTLFWAFTPPPSVINPGSCGSFPVTFQSNFSGSFSALLSIPNNDSNEDPYEITLIGEAVPRQ